MNCVITLVVKPGDTLPLAEAKQITADLLQKTPDWHELSPHEAVEAQCDIADGAAIRAAFDSALKGLPVDWALLPDHLREKKLMVADMDSTMITIECIDELADYAGIKDEVAAVTEQAMRGELDFEEALKARVALLAGLPAARLDECYNERLRYSDGAVTTVRTMASRGTKCALVSGGFTYFTERVAEHCGFHTHRANQLEVKNGHLTGSVLPPISKAETKKAELESMVGNSGHPLAASLALGDGANDVPMIEAAGLGIAYQAKPLAEAAADACINHTALTSVLFFQGIPRSAFTG